MRWAEEDARRFLEGAVELGGVVEGRAILLLGSIAGDVRRELVRLRGQVEEANRHGLRTELLLFYSGHGDESALRLGSSRLELEELRNLVQAIPAQAAVTIIDACRSGTLVRGRHKGATHGPAFEINIARNAGPTGRVVIMAAGRHEVAQESDDLRSSFFTHHLLSGMRGAADKDADGNVTLAELYRYTYHHTVASSHGETAAVQHPEIEMDLAGEGELVISTLSRSTCRLVLGADVTGDVLVVDDRNARVMVELRKALGVHTTLALPSGRFRVQVRDEGRIYAGEVELAWGGERRISRSTLAEQPLVAVLQKGSAFDPSVWTLAALFDIGAASALDQEILLGGRLAARRRLFAWPLYAAAALRCATGEHRGTAWRYRHVEASLEARLQAGWFFGPVNAHLGGGAGALLVYENARRQQASRVEAMSGVVASTASWTVGPVMTLGAGASVPIQGALAVELGADVSTAWLRIEDAVQSSMAWHAFAGLAYEL